MSVLKKAIVLFKASGILVVVISVILTLYTIFVVTMADTETPPERFGQVNSTLYAGTGENQPLLVGLGGAEGGNAWASDYWKPQRDRFIEQGYAFLAIAYFGEAGIPAELDRIAVEGVYNAIIQAANDPRINRDCIALIGGSKGAELALLLASHYPEIKAVGAIVPGNAVFVALTSAMSTSSFTMHDEPLPFVPVPWSALPALLLGDLRSAWEIMLQDEIAVMRAAIPVENINGPVFFLSATEDEFWPSSEMSQSMMSRLDEHDFEYPHQHIAIDGNHSAPLAHISLVEDFFARHFLSESEQGCPRSD